MEEESAHVIVGVEVAERPVDLAELIALSLFARMGASATGFRRPASAML